MARCAVCARDREPVCIAEPHGAFCFRCTKGLAELFLSLDYAHVQELWGVAVDGTNPSRFPAKSAPTVEGEDGSDRAILLRAAQFTGAGDLETAVELYLKAADNFEATQFPVGAAACLRQVLRLAPEHAEAKTRYGQLMEGRGLDQAAFEELRQLAHFRPDEVLEAEFLVISGEVDAALNHLEEASKSLDGGVSSPRSSCVVRLPEPPDSGQASDAESLETHRNLSIAYAEMGLVVDALTEASRALSLATRPADVRDVAELLARHLVDPVRASAILFPS